RRSRLTVSSWACVVSIARWAAIERWTKLPASGRWRPSRVEAQGPAAPATWITPGRPDSTSAITQSASRISRPPSAASTRASSRATSAQPPPARRSVRLAGRSPRRVTRCSPSRRSSPGQMVSTRRPARLPRRALLQRITPSEPISAAPSASASATASSSITGPGLHFRHGKDEEAALARLRALQLELGAHPRGQLPADVETEAGPGFGGFLASPVEALEDVPGDGGRYAQAAIFDLHAGQPARRRTDPGADPALLAGKGERVAEQRIQDAREVRGVAGDHQWAPGALEAQVHSQAARPGPGAVDSRGDQLVEVDRRRQAGHLTGVQARGQEQVLHQVPELVALGHQDLQRGLPALGNRAEAAFPEHRQVAAH